LPCSIIERDLVGVSVLRGRPEGIFEALHEKFFDLALFCSYWWAVDGRRSCSRSRLHG
jgi:hypothetical protein